MEILNDICDSWVQEAQSETLKTHQKSIPAQQSHFSIKDLLPPGREQTSIALPAAKRLAFWMHNPV